MDGRISQPDFVDLAERAGLNQKQMDYLRLYVGVDGPRLRPIDIARVLRSRPESVSSVVAIALAKVASLPFIPAGLPQGIVRKPKKLVSVSRPTMMTKKQAERIIGGPVAIGEREGGFVRVACYDPFGEVISETGRYECAALDSLVKANYRRAREFVFKRDNYRCTNCGGFGSLEADHVKARSHGRSDLVDNLKTLCEGCHKIRHKAKAFYGPFKPRPSRRPEEPDEVYDPADDYPNPGPYTWAEMLEEEERLAACGQLTE